MRTWGRITHEDGRQEWVAVETSPAGDNTSVWLTTLVQTLKLSLGESPFYAQYGIPAQQSIVQQIYPDYYVNIVQQQFAQYFASLTIKRVPGKGGEQDTYRVDVITFEGVEYSETIPV